MSQSLMYYDDRERHPELLPAIKSYPAKMKPTRLDHGDYACIAGCCAFERKQSDFSEAQFHRIKLQLHELNMAYKNAYLVVNDDYAPWVQRNGLRQYPARKGFVASLTSRGFAPFFVTNHTLMLDWMHETVKKNHDNKLRGAGEFMQMRHISHKDRALNILLALPNVGPTHAVAILDHFGSVMNFLRAEEGEIQQVKGIGPKTSGRIVEALCREID